MLVAMRRVDIVAPRRRGADVVRVVHRLGALHLAPFELPEGLTPGGFGVNPATPPGTPFDAALERVADLGELLGPRIGPGHLVDELWDLDPVALLREADALEPVRARVAALTGERVLLGSEEARLGSYRRLVEGLSSAIGHLPSIRGYGSTGIVVHTRYRAVIGLIRDELEELTGGRCEILAAEMDPDRVAAILLYPARVAEDVRALLGGRDLEEVALPEEFQGVPFDQLGPELGQEQSRVQVRLATVEAELAALSAAHGARVAALRDVLEDRVAEARALHDSGISDHLVILGGWLPAGRVAELRDALAAEVGPEVLVEERPHQARDPRTPVAFENQPFLRAFEPLASFISMPRYGSLDPTPLLALTFPAFVGLMVADVGYGLLLLGLLLWARRRWRGEPLMGIVWPIGVLSAAATIGFGVLFGEWFGDAGQQFLGLGPVWLDRREAIVPLLVLAISIGVAQVGLGLVLGMVNAVLLRHRGELARRGALLVSLVAVLVIIGWLARLMPEAMGQVALAALLVALVVLVATAGLAGPIEVVGVLGNVLSYARLMAIGLASVMLALVANRLGGLPENVVLGVVVAAVIHALNLVLGFFDSSVQGLRLHYVEFFSKFVEPGGVRYEPFVSALARDGTRLPVRPSGGP